MLYGNLTGVLDGRYDEDAWIFSIRTVADTVAQDLYERWDVNLL